MALNGRMERAGSLALGLAVLLVAMPSVAAVPRLLDLHGAGIHSAVVRHDDGTWRAYASGEPAAKLAMTPKVVWHWAASGDFNGDGYDDVLLRRTDGAWVLYPFRDGDVVVAERGWSRLTRNLDWRPVGVGDFNGDGRDDLLVRRHDGRWLYYPMRGRHVIGAERGWASLPRSPDWRMAGVGDFDADGRDDVLLRHVDGSWRLFPMDGRKVVTERVSEPAFSGTAWRLVAVGDFDADGRSDVLLRHLSGRWSYERLVGDVVLKGTPGLLPRDWNWRLTGVGDLDGDGRDDVVLRHRSGAWRNYTALDGRTVDVTPPWPSDFAWRMAAPPVHLPDPALRNLARNALGLAEGSPITRRAISRLTRLEARGAGIADLTGISQATGLRVLMLPAELAGRPHETTDAVIEDLRALAGLTELSALRLGGNDVSDLSPLAHLPSLEVLGLSLNNVEDITALSALHRLRTLELAHNRVSDLTPLAGLHELTELVADFNRVADLTPLSALDNLAKLHMHWNEIEDVTPLAGLSALTSLRLESNRIADIAPLADLTELRVLSLNNNRIADASAVSELTELWFLSLSRNEVTDISPLSGLTKMGWLWLGHNEISDVTPLTDMRDLTRLYLQSNAITDISPLAGFTRLEMLALDDNAITDIGALAEMTVLTDLGASQNRIADISVLRDLVRLESLDLGSNRVVDVGALEFLTELKDLDLSYNLIADIGPLAANEGLGEGDRIDLRGNPLSVRSTDDFVPILVSRGSQVEAPLPMRSFTVHDDSVVVFPVDQNIATETVFTGLPLHEYAAEFYRGFEDEFDFLMFFSNLDDIDDHEESPYYGVYLSVRNDVEGTGSSKHYDNRYGSRERLMGAIHFPYNRALMYGPSLHEIMHAWANYALPTAVGSHWGFSSANGQLGGFDLADLEDLGGGRYAAGRFGTFANGGNGPGYSPIELYLAGFLPPEEVPDLWVAEDGHWEFGQDGTAMTTEAGHWIFHADDVRTYTIDDIVERGGERIPTMAEAQWHFRAAVILLTDEDHPATPEQLDLLSEHAAWFSQPASDHTRLHNFHEATRGRGSITLDGLATAQRATAAPTPPLPASYGPIPPAHASLADGTCIAVDQHAMQELGAGHEH